MKPLFLFLFLSGYSPLLAASSSSADTSKPVIDSTAINHWVSLGYDFDLSITENGKYFSYCINNQPVNSRTLVVQAINDGKKRYFPGARMGSFSADSQKFIFISGDTLYALSLDTDQLQYLAQTTAYLQPFATKGGWVAWQVKNKPDELVVHHLVTGKELRFNHVTGYSFHQQGDVLVIETSAIQAGKSLQWVSLTDEKVTTIWTSDGSNTSTGYAIDQAGKQLALMVSHGNQYTLWYYSKGMDKAIVKASNQSPGITAGFTLQNIAYFSDDGHYILLGLQQSFITTPEKEDVKLQIWHYRDKTLRSAILSQPTPPVYTAVISTDSIPGKANAVVRLQQDNEESKAPPGGGYMIFGKNVRGDRYWMNPQDSNWLVSMRDGSRRLLKTTGTTFFRFSPNGKYLIYYDAGQQHHYFSYHLQTGKLVDISTAVPPGYLKFTDEYEQPAVTASIADPAYNVGIAAWLTGDTALLVYDNYDIWQLDITGKRTAMNITNGYGRLHHIKFRVVKDWTSLVVPADTVLLLNAYNTVNKHNGFYHQMSGTVTNPVLLTMGPYAIDLNGEHFYTGNGMDYDAGIHPLKARNANVWIIKRQTAVAAPNYFVTNDLIHYQALTDLHPQDDYNWLTAELVSFKQSDGTLTQGILYKPENFDPHRKYPVILNYYEQLTHRLYQYPKPGYSRNNIDVAWFVSRGYLVFTPDIHFARSGYGEGASRTMVGAARYLSNLPYVNPLKLGISGHSFGGFLTNYIISHTGLFAAAVESAGTSNWISSSLQLSGVEGDVRSSRLPPYEYQMGASLWQRPDLYIQNSPVLMADKITTPLLILHSKSDTAVPWEQAVELFIALRRLNKKAWMLQYDGQNHGNYGKPAEDYTIRLTQFFDHYLKGALPPKWMTHTVSEPLQELEEGFESDKSGLQP
jgi:dipeptidyl aminopeptidase/acylaminoacyl peptidase